MTNIYRKIGVLIIIILILVSLTITMSRLQQENSNCMKHMSSTIKSPEEIHQYYLDNCTK